MLPAAPGAPSEGKLKPGIGGYLAGGAIMGAALVGATVVAFMAFWGFLQAFDDFDRVSLDETTELVLDIGTYDVYLLGDGVGRGSVFGAEDLRITDPNGNQRAVVVRSEDPLALGSETYTPRLTFDAPVPGTYTFEPLAGADGAPEIDGLAVGPEIEDLFEDMLPWFLAAGALGLVGIGVGSILLIVTGVRRGKAKRAARGWPPGAGPPAGPQAPAGPTYAPGEVVEGSWASSTPAAAPAASQPSPAQLSWQAPPSGPAPGAPGPGAVPPSPAPPAPAPAAPPADPWSTPGRQAPPTTWGAPPGSDQPR